VSVASAGVSGGACARSGRHRLLVRVLVVLVVGVPVVVSFPAVVVVVPLTEM
jgi:hypothetical protein